MVRIIAGTLLEVGMGAYPPEDDGRNLDARDRQAAGDARHRPEALPLVSMEYQQELPFGITGRTNTGNMTFWQSHIKQDKTAYFVIPLCADEELDGICGEYPPCIPERSRPGYM